MTTPTVLRLAAFPAEPGGGNPAGVVLDADPEQLDEAAMRRTAAEVGFSETAFITDGPAREGRRHYRVRYFSPEAEVPFCGHATIALGVALAERIGPGPLMFDTPAGPIPVQTGSDDDGRLTAAFASAEPEHRPVEKLVLAEALHCLGWNDDDLDARIPPAVTFAGAWHLVLAVRDRQSLHDLHYDYDELRRLSLQHTWVTVHIAWMESPVLHHVRAPFPFGGVLEDPATGAGAAAYGAYLRALGVFTPPVDFDVLQGEDMGRPSRIHVTVPSEGPVVVRGTAVPMS